MVLDEGNATVTRDKRAGHTYLGSSALLQGQALISSMATPCLVSVDGAGAAGVSAGERLGSPRGLVGFSVVVCTVPVSTTGVGEACSAPNRVALTVAWGRFCLSHNGSHIWRFSSGLTQIQVANLNLAVELSRGP